MERFCVHESVDYQEYDFALSKVSSYTLQFMYTY